MIKRIERQFENALFASRWLLAPFYVGLVLAIGLLLAVFAREFLTAVPAALTMSVEAAILKVLTLLDLALAANLILVVILAGYESFVSKIDTEGHEDRPGWMGTTSFSGLKLKLYASIVAISGIQLLKSFMAIGSKPLTPTELGWMTIIHFAFVMTAVLSAVTDYLSSRSKGASCGPALRRPDGLLTPLSMSDPEAVWRSAYRHPGAWDRTFPPATMVELFEVRAAERPQAPLLDFLGRRYSYGEVFDGANRVACGLAAMGYGPGDRIGLFLPNVPHYVAAYYGILRLGATVVNFSPLYSVTELAHQVADSGTRLLFTLSASALLPTAIEVLDGSSLERLVVGSVAGALPAAKSIVYRMFRRREVSRRPADPRITAFSALIANSGECVPAPIDPMRDVALIQYTGGTTGTPKGAMLTHQNISANGRQIAALDPHAGDGSDTVLGVLPFFHVFANTCVLNRTVLTGGEIVMLPRFDAGQVLAVITRTRPRALPGVPTMFQALLDHPRRARTDFTSLQYCISGGAPLSAELKIRFETATGATLIEGYGLSESAGVVACNPYRGPQKPGTIGQPIAGTRVRLVDKDDPRRPPSASDPGEIVVAGPQIMAGYWHRPDADAETFVTDADGTRWLRTGDIGAIDAEGYIRIVDRLKDMIAVGGFKVFPSQIEAVLHHHPAIRDALVIGLPDAYRGEHPRAYVTLAEGAEATGDALREWLNPQLGKHERVDAVVVRESLPRTMIGKLSRKDLVAEVMSGER